MNARPTSRTAPLARRLAAVGLGLVALAGAAGCSATNPVTTGTPYALSDGVRVALGPLTGLNLLVVSAAKGDDGVLSGAFANSSDQDLQIDVSLTGGTPTHLDVPARGTVYVGTGTDAGTAVALGAVDAAPGQLVGLTIDGDATGGTTVQVPVLDGTLPQYATLVPTPSATASATPSPTTTAP